MQLIIAFLHSVLILLFASNLISAKGFCFACFGVLLIMDILIAAKFDFVNGFLFLNLGTASKVDLFKWVDLDCLIYLCSGLIFHCPLELFISLRKRYLLG